MSHSVTNPGKSTSFWAQLEREGLSALTATFKDKNTEASYARHLVDTQLKQERVIWWGVIGVFFGFAFLDMLTIKEGLKEILALRFIVGVLVIGLVPLTYIRAFKPHFGSFCALGLFIFSAAIVAMISIMPAEGAPPYIIGVLVCFIASSCMMRINFLVASSVYAAVSLIYLAVLNLDPDFSRVDIVSGHFFMISIATVAIVTIYFQEIRSRVIWRRDQQRDADASYIERLLIEATAADQSKINFLSMMSHEMRTPLHQIIGFSQIVESDFSAAEKNEESAGHITQIQSSAKMLLSRIQKMLRFADATAGKIEYDRAATSVREVVEASLEQLCTDIEKQGIRVDVTEIEDAKLYVDIFHSCYALNNILENALNASTINGRVWITGKLLEDNRYRLIIRDEGEGMSPEQIEKALKPFSQTEQVLNRTTEGVGLGLTLASRIFEGQDATLTIDSTPTVGTSVVIDFKSPKAIETVRRA